MAGDRDGPIESAQQHATQHPKPNFYLPPPTALDVVCHRINCQKFTLILQRMPTSINPWLGLSPSAPFVLAEDRLSIESFNAKLLVNSPHRFDVETVIPEPFIGNVTTASVIVLQLNPGLDPVKDPVRMPNQHFVPPYSRTSAMTIKCGRFIFLIRNSLTLTPEAFGGRARQRSWLKQFRFRSLAANLLSSSGFRIRVRNKGRRAVPSQEYGFSLVSSAIYWSPDRYIKRKRIFVGELRAGLAELNSRKLTLSSVSERRTYDQQLEASGRKNRSGLGVCSLMLCVNLFESLSADNYSRNSSLNNRNPRGPLTLHS